jgi:hypothetical protein
MEDTFNEELYNEPEKNEPEYEFAGKSGRTLKDLYKDLGSWYADMF